MRQLVPQSCYITPQDNARHRRARRTGYVRVADGQSVLQRDRIKALAPTRGCLSHVFEIHLPKLSETLRIGHLHAAGGEALLALTVAYAASELVDALEGAQTHILAERYEMNVCSLGSLNWMARDRCHGLVSHVHFGHVKCVLASLATGPRTDNHRACWH
jgi:hypothetical protein